MNTKISRLKKVAFDNSYNNGRVSPSSIIFKDPWKWVDNDEITQIKYHTTENKEWLFDKPIDNMEWELQK